MIRRMAVFPILGLALFLATANPAPAQGTILGARIGVYTDLEDLFVGGELLFPVSRAVYINPNVEWVFVENGTYMTFNLDAHYDIYPRGSSAFFWLGGGLGIIYRDVRGPGGSNADAGVNLLGGVGWRTRSGVSPYLQVKIILSDNSQGVVGIGMRF